MNVLRRKTNAMILRKMSTTIVENWKIYKQRVTRYIYYSLVNTILYMCNSSHTYHDKRQQWNKYLCYAHDISLLDDKWKVEQRSTENGRVRTAVWSCAWGMCDSITEGRRVEGRSFPQVLYGYGETDTKMYHRVSFGSRDCSILFFLSLEWLWHILKHKTVCWPRDRTMS